MIFTIKDAVFPCPPLSIPLIFIFIGFVIIKMKMMEIPLVNVKVFLLSMIDKL